MTSLTIRLLGVPEVHFGERPVSFRTRKVLALLVYLLVEREMHSRASLMALLWPESTPKSAATTLRVTLSRLRKALRPAGDVLISESGNVGFDSRYVVDLDLDWLAAAERPEMSPDELTPILTIDRGEFLAGFSLPDAPEFDTWITIQRAACQRQLETVYDRLSQYLLTTNNSSAAVETAARWVARAPLNEQAYRRLMAAQALSGQRPAALQTYRRLQATLQEEMSLEPSRESVVLADNISRGGMGVEHHGSSGIVGPAATWDRGRPLMLPLVGRADEHSRLVAAFHQTSKDGAGVMALIGAAGAGKTRLLGAFLEWAMLDSSQAEIWQGRVFETGGRLAYQPVVEALRARVAAVNAPEDLLEDVWLAELSQLMPELRARYPDLPPPMVGDARFVRARLFEAVARLGTALTAQRPAILVLDDMQWADAATLGMVHYLVRRWAEAGTPVLLVLALRQEAYAADTALREWLTRLERDVPLTRLLLDSLNGAAVAQLVDRLAAEGAEETANSAFAAWLWAETRGLPFFIEALLHMLVEQGVLPVNTAARPAYDFATGLKHVRSAAPVPLPPGVREVIRARLAQHSKEAGTLLLAAAVLGRACTFERLCQIAGLQETDALDALETLLNGRLLAERPSDRRPYTLAHDYIREVVYTESREARRRVFHRRALLALEAAAAPAAECAFHALASLLDEPSLRYSLAAGDEALAKYALEESLAHYNRARDVSRTMAGEEIAAETLQRLYQNRGRAFELGQQDEAARDNYAELLALAEARNDLSLKLTALTAQCIIYVTGLSVFNPGRARALSQDAVGLARTIGDRTAEARALWCMMLVEHFSGGKTQKILALGNEALAIAQALGLKELMGYVQTNLAWAYFNNEQLKEANKANDEARAIWQALGNLPMVADSYTIKLHMYNQTGEYDALLALEQKALRVSRATNNVLHEGMALLNICSAHCSQGRFGEAMATLEAVKRIAASMDQIPDPYLGVYLYSISIFLYVGALEEAEQWADKLYAQLDTFQPVVRTFFLVAVARAKIAVGKLREAEDILVRDLTVLDQDNPAMIDMVPVYVADARFQLALGHPERALERLGAVLQRLHHTGSRNCLAEAQWLQGRARLGLGEIAQAREALWEAKAEAEVTSERPILWQILVALSAVEKLRGDETVTARLRAEARAVVDDIADHAGELRETFLSRPAVAVLLHEA